MKCDLLCLKLSLVSILSIIIFLDFAPPAEANSCHEGAAWYSKLDGSSGYAGLIPCEEEEPAAKIALSCFRGSDSINVSLDILPSEFESGDKSFSTKITIDNFSYNYDAVLDEIGMTETLNFTISDDDPFINSMLSGTRGTIKFGNAFKKFHLKGSSKAIGSTLKTCGIKRAKIKKPNLAIQSANEFSNSIQTVSTIRTLANGFGGECSSEEALIKTIQPSAFFQVTKNNTTPNQTVPVKWSADVVDTTIPMYLIASFNKPVRFEGEGFYSLLPGTVGPFGIDWNVNKTRIVAPLSGKRVDVVNVFELETILSGSINVEWQVFGYLRNCEKIVNGPVTSSTVEVALGKAKILASDNNETEKPQRVVVSPNGERRMEVHHNYFRLLSQKNSIEIGNYQGADPTFSPTGRFLTYVQNASAGPFDTVLEVLDTVDGKKINSFNGNRISWTHNDSFFASPSKLSNTAIFKREYVGYQGPPGTPDDKGIRFDLENNLVVKYQQWYNYSSKDGVITKNTFDDVSFGSLSFLTTANLKALELEKAALEKKYIEAKKTIKDNEKLAKLSKIFINEHNSLSMTFTISYQTFTNNRPETWEFSEDIGYHKVTRNYLKYLKNEFPDAYTDIVSRVLAEPKFGQSKLVSASVDNDEFKFSNTTIAKLNKVVTGSKASVSPASASWSQILERDGVKSNFSLKPSAAYQSKKLGTGKLYNYGVKSIRGNLLGAAEAIVKDFPNLKCLIGVNAVPTSQKLGVTDYFIGEALKSKIFQGNRDCNERGTNRMSRINCGEPEINHRRSKLLGGWKLDLETNGVFARRWVVNDEPVWIVMQHCMEGEDFNLTGTSMHMITSQGGGKIIPLDFALKPNDEQAVSTLGASVVNNYITKVFADGSVIIVDRALGVVVMKRIVSQDSNDALFQIDNAQLIDDIALLAEKNFLVFANTNDTFSLIDQEKLSDNPSAKPVLRGAIEDDEYVIWTEGNQFDSSPEGANNIRIGFDGLPSELHTFHQFRSTMYEKNLLQKILNRSELETRIIKVPPVLSAEFNKENTKRVAGIFLVDSSLPIANLSVYQDGLLTNKIPLSDFVDTALPFDVPRLAGARWVSLVAVDSKGLASQPVGIDLGSDPEVKGRLSLVNIGIDQYSNPSFNLTGAKKDAETIVNSMQNIPDKTLKDATLLVDENASREKIIEAIKTATQNAQLGDTVVISYAGHGMRGPDGNFYLSTHETDLERLSETTVAWSEVNELLSTSKGRIIMLIDACHAGAAGTSFFTTNDEVVDDLLAGIPTNIIIFAASKGRELSFEAPNGLGGIFSTSVAEVIGPQRSKYDLNQNGAIEVSEFYRGVKYKVVVEGEPIRRKAVEGG